MTQTASVFNKREDNANAFIGIFLTNCSQYKNNIKDSVISLDKFKNIQRASTISFLTVPKN